MIFPTFVSYNYFIVRFCLLIERKNRLKSQLKIYEIEQQIINDLHFLNDNVEILRID